MASGGSNKPKDSISEQGEYNSDTYSELTNDHLKLTKPIVPVKMKNFGTQPTPTSVGTLTEGLCSGQYHHEPRFRCFCILSKNLKVI